jgi:hypothetical protein
MGVLKYLGILGAHGRAEELGEDRVQRAFVARAGWLRLIHGQEPTSWSAVASRSRTSRPCLTRPNYSQSVMDLEGGAGQVRMQARGVKRVKLCPADHITAMT